MPPVDEPINPCNPSPCGANAVCKERNGAGSCLCLPEYFGDPYAGCRPECVQNSECDRSKACVNNKCKDPCPGVCGINASEYTAKNIKYISFSFTSNKQTKICSVVCRAQNHAPTCYCDVGYIGDPAVACHPEPGMWLNHIHFFRLFQLLHECTIYSLVVFSEHVYFTNTIESFGSYCSFS